MPGQRGGASRPWLPGYAPDLNPVEAIWSHTKYSDLANYVHQDADHLLDAVGARVIDASRATFDRTKMNMANPTNPMLALGVVPSQKWTGDPPFAAREYDLK